MSILPSPLTRDLDVLAIAVLAVLVLVAALAGLLNGYAAILPLPIGLPGFGMVVGIDPLSWVFLLILAPQTIAACLAARAHKSRSPGEKIAFALFCAAMVWVIVARDSFSLIFAFELMSVASFFLVLAGDQDEQHSNARLYIGIGIFSGACLIPAFSLLGAGIWPGVVFGLLLVGAGAKAGLFPLHAWLPRAHPAPPAYVSAVMSGGMVMLAIYLILRVGFIGLASQVSPVSLTWWGLALIIPGAGSALIGSLRAALETDLKTLLAASTVEQVGLIAMALGVGLTARGLGHPEIAVMALQAALLFALAHGLFKPLLFIAAGGIIEVTGSHSLDWLGGLLRAMPRFGLCVLMGAWGMSGLPPGPGFAPVYLLLHAIIAASGASSGLLAQAGFAALLSLLGLTEALAAFAALRLFGIGFLGRPRSLRAAAAEEARGPILQALVWLAGLIIVLGLLPGLALRLISPAIAALVPGAHEPFSQALVAPLGLIGLIMLVGVLAIALLSRVRRPDARYVDLWQGGFAKPPIWQPFGDPGTQASATGFAEPVRRALGRSILGAHISIEPAAPGSALAATVVSGFVDPTERFLLGPVLRAFASFVVLLDWINRLTLLHRLMLVVGVVVAFLLALGLISGG
ncbi:MAG TPA: proton-conducting transporter membrane subunit [Acetobacteraceae bacterium]|nr:proton-conducting transporter membrane subunit [Acetobacteraceae bacterium]